MNGLVKHIFQKSAALEKQIQKTPPPAVTGERKGTEPAADAGNFCIEH